MQFNHDHKKWAYVKIQGTSSPSQIKTKKYHTYNKETKNHEQGSADIRRNGASGLGKTSVIKLSDFKKETNRKWGRVSIQGYETWSFPRNVQD